MLPAYFDALDTFVAGWLITVIVDKAIPTLIGIGGPGAKDYIHRVLEDGGVGGWKPKVAERMLRIAHFASYLSALVLSDGLKLFWMTDNDAIVPNAQQAQRTIEVFHSLIPEYTSKKLGDVGWATPFSDRECMLHHDLLSAADLAAGAFCDYCNSQRQPDMGTMPARSEPVLEWLARKGSGLRKTTVLIEPSSGRDLKITGLQGSDYDDQSRRD